MQYLQAALVVNFHTLAIGKFARISRIYRALAHEAGW